MQKSFGGSDIFRTFAADLEVAHDTGLSAELMSNKTRTVIKALSKVAEAQTYLTHLLLNIDLTGEEFIKADEADRLFQFASDMATRAEQSNRRVIERHDVMTQGH